MSTFGKKSLLKWDYYNYDYRRYRSSNNELQLEILKKWYPIGEVFYFNEKRIKIKGYVLFSDYFYKVSFDEINLASLSNNESLYNRPNFVEKTVFPLKLRPSKEFLRNIKLNEILNDK